MQVPVCLVSLVEEERQWFKVGERTCYMITSIVIYFFWTDKGVDQPTDLPGWRSRRAFLGFGMVTSIRPDHDKGRESNPRSTIGHVSSNGHAVVACSRNLRHISALLRL